MLPLFTTRLACLFTLLAFLTLWAGPARGQAPTWQWATSPGPATGLGSYTATDGAGNVYLTGYFRDSITLGTTTLIGAGNDDLYVAKLTSGGTYLWAVSVGDTASEYCSAIAVDAAGNVYVTGAFSSPALAFGSTTLTRTGADPFAEECFVAKLTTAGTWQWAQHLGSANGDIHGHSVCVDPGGNVYLGGDYDTPTFTAGPTTLINSSTGFDMFVAKLNAAGVWQWAAGGGGLYSEFAVGVAADGAGNVYLTGSFDSQTVSFGPTTLTNSAGTAGTSDLYVAKLTAGGAWQWATSASGLEREDAAGIGVDGAGNALVLGSYFSSTITFGTTTLTNSSVGFADTFVAKLSPAGVWQWATDVGGADHETSTALAVDSSGSTYLIGYSKSLGVRFGPLVYLNSHTGDYADGFVAKLSPAGTWVGWPAAFTCSRTIYTANLAVDGSGNVYLTGDFTRSPAVFGSITVASPNGFGGAFLAKLYAGPTGLPATTGTSGLTLWPNPVHHTVQISGATGPTATLLDALGRTISSTPLTAGAATLDVRALPAGLYLLRAGAATRRLVVE